MALKRTINKNNWNKKTYDQIKFVVKKGEAEKIKEYAKSIGKSTNAFIVDIIYKEMEKAE